MSKFYGTIISDKRATNATAGSNNDIAVIAQTYDFSVYHRLWYNDNNELMIDIKYCKGSKSFAPDMEKVGTYKFLDYIAQIMK